MLQTKEKKFVSGFQSGVARSTGADKEKVLITNRVQQRRRNLKSVTAVPSKDRDLTDFRLLDNGIMLIYTVTQNNTNVETITRLIAEGSTTNGGLIDSLLAAGYNGLTVAAPTVVDLSPTSQPTLSPVKQSSLSKGGIAGIVISVIFVAGLMAYALYYFVFRKSSTGNSYVSDFVPPPTGDSSPRAHNQQTAN